MISNYETLILGEDGESPIRPIIEKCLTQAREDGVRLCIEIRTKPRGVRNSRSEHNLVADPDNTAIETVMQVIIEQLNESPGENYDGEIRINFTQEGTPANRYASFTRQMKTTLEGWGHELRMQAALREVVSQHNEGPTEVPTEMSWTEATRLNDERIERLMGLLFRSNAQMIAMFERSTRMMESITMRYGAPESSLKSKKKTKKLKRKLKNATKKLQAEQVDNPPAAEE